jgi:predicted ArsR family transcriptional regulator
MSLRLTLAELYVPASLRRAGLNELAAAAATACESGRPHWRSRRLSDRLQEFAHFTSLRAATASAERRGEAARDRLRQEAEEVGRRLRRRLGVGSHDEALRALRLLYQQIGIELQTPRCDRIEITSCLFSRFYDPATCRFMSAMDEGIVAGLTGGWQLRFEARLTEGAHSCAASLARPERCTRSS